MVEKHQYTNPCYTNLCVATAAWVRLNCQKTSNIVSSMDKNRFTNVIALKRLQRSYDPRLRQFVCTTGDTAHALRIGVPRLGLGYCNLALA